MNNCSIRVLEPARSISAPNTGWQTIAARLETLVTVPIMVLLKPR